MRKPTRYTIIEEHQVFMTGWGLGDDERIAAALRDVLNAIPEEARSIILHHWATKPPPWHKDIPMPDIEAWEHITSMVPLPTGEVIEYRCIACISLQGHKMQFDTPTLSRHTDEYMRYICAHELAHVFEYATNKSGQVYEGYHSHFDAHHDAENETDIVAAAWGFPNPEPDDDWDWGELI